MQFDSEKIVIEKSEQEIDALILNYQTILKTAMEDKHLKRYGYYSNGSLRYLIDKIGTDDDYIRYTAIQSLVTAVSYMKKARREMISG